MLTNWRRVPVSTEGFTYVFVPKAVVQGLDSKLELNFPDLPPVDISGVLGTDVINIVVNPNEVVLAG